MEHIQLHQLWPVTAPFLSPRDPAPPPHPTVPSPPSPGISAGDSSFGAGPAGGGGGDATAASSARPASARAGRHHRHAGRGEERPEKLVIAPRGPGPGDQLTDVKGILLLKGLTQL